MSSVPQDGFNKIRVYLLLHGRSMLEESTLKSCFQRRRESDLSNRVVGPFAVVQAYRVHRYAYFKWDALFDESIPFLSRCVPFVRTYKPTAP